MCKHKHYEAAQEVAKYRAGRAMHLKCLLRNGGICMGEVMASRSSWCRADVLIDSSR